MPPEHISGDYYTGCWCGRFTKAIRFYAPGKEPRGYFERLKQLEPEIVFDPAKLKTEADWIKAGELAFDAPGGYDSDLNFEVRNPAWYEKVRVPLTKDGVMPYRRYVIRKKGIVEVGNFGCAMCHTRVMADGSVVKGAQGNLPLDRTFVFLMRTGAQPEQQRLEVQRGFVQGLFATPWLRPDPLARIGQMSLEELAPYTKQSRRA